MKLFSLKSGFILLVALSLLIGFALKAQNQSPQNDTDLETPELLDPDASKNAYDYSFGRSKGNSNIIEDLFKEAKEKEETLQSIADEIRSFSDKKYGSRTSVATPFKKYHKTNENYWRAANFEIEQIKNPDQKTTLKKAFQLLEEAYQASVKNHTQALSEIDQRADQLSDQLIILKLCVTAKMIKKYQVNELPEIAALKQLISDYDAVISKAEGYCNFE